MSAATVCDEVLAALEMFTAEGFADMVGFRVVSGVVTAEEYGSEGEVLGTYSVTVSVEAVSA